MNEDTTKNLPNSDLKLILARLDSIDSRLDDMNGRLEKLEARAYDTKPIWERALAEIIEVKNRLGAVEERLSAVERASKQVVRKFDLVGRDLLTLSADHEDLVDRVEKLEPASIS
jgi:tetrahydromethanopterin S-methyltransferase subunit G